MHKIDSPHATVGNEFTDGDPASGIEATELWAKWFNTVQRELIAILESAGITPDDADDTQVIESINQIFPMRTKKIDLGFWDMESTPSILTIEHGIELDKLIGVREVQILSDNGIMAGRWPLNMVNSTNGVVAGGFYISTIYLALWRTEGGFFDGASFNSPAVNRGFAIVDYLP